MLTIQDFHALLTSDNEDNALLAALRELTKLVDIEEIATIISRADIYWK